MEKGTLYFHAGCFDGLVSAALAQAFLETQDWEIQHFVPVNYDIQASWPSTHLKTPAAVVDFLYHEDASFWADHHANPFRTPETRRNFDDRRTKNCLLYDEHAGSCASLLWNSLGHAIPDAERFRDAVFWAEKFDSANYATVDEAIFGDSPAFRIKHSLDVEDTAEYYGPLLQELRSGDLNRVAELAPVGERSKQAQGRIRAGIERARNHTRLEGEVAVMDIQSNHQDVVSRYAPYYFFPRARYSISLMHSESEIRITAMRNPWMNFRSVPLGKIMEDFGGGGHERVGAVLLSSHHSEQAGQIVDRLLAEMQSHTPSESVTA